MQFVIKHVLQYYVIFLNKNRIHLPSLAVKLVPLVADTRSSEAEVYIKHNTLGPFTICYNSLTKVKTNNSFGHTIIVFFLF